MNVLLVEFMGERSCSLKVDGILARDGAAAAIDMSQRDVE
jgi:hypothetical protein